MLKGKLVASPSPLIRATVKIYIAYFVFALAPVIAIPSSRSKVVIYSHPHGPNASLPTRQLSRILTTHALLH